MTKGAKTYWQVRVCLAFINIVFAILLAVTLWTRWYSGAGVSEVPYILLLIFPCVGSACLLPIKEEVTIKKLGAAMILWGFLVGLFSSGLSAYIGKKYGVDTSQASLFFPSFITFRDITLLYCMSAWTVLSMPITRVV